ncbi:MAG: NUDIX hydrolase [Anaerolineae bacterium]|nr:NUDIX hydrolase [Anaerolineae bacterium]MCA9894254.1 NUDIX hydrolase [Anaerolineae bacterium]
MTESPESLPNWLAWSRRLQAIAQIGLTFSQDPYDIERYHQIRDIASEIAAAHTGLDAQTITDLYNQEKGYMTPKVDVRGVVVNPQRELLLVREASDGLWTLPGGWADVHDTPAQAVEREIKEESGYDARAIKLLAAYDRDTQGHPPIPYSVYKLFFLCELQGGNAQTSHETDEIGFFALDALPPLSIGRVNARQIHRFYEHIQQPDLPTDFD